MWRITVRLGIREGAGRRTVSPRPSQKFRSMEELKVFQACDAVNVETGDMFLVNVETGDMFLRITQNG